MKKRPLVIGSTFCFSCCLFLGACSSSTNSRSSSSDCSALEPENPYSEGTGHYAGYEWAETNQPSSCGGNSTSFIEGCEKYREQVRAYKDCMEKR